MHHILTRECDILPGAHKHKLSQTNCFWILVQLQARQAQLKRRLAVIERHSSSAWGWRHSIYQRWRIRALISAESPTGRRTRRQTRSDLSSFHRRSLLHRSSVRNCSILLPPKRCVFCRFRMAAAYATCWSQPPADTHIAVTHMQQTCSQGNFSAIANKGEAFLLLDEFSWPINYFLPGRA